MAKFKTELERIRHAKEVLKTTNRLDKYTKDEKQKAFKYLPALAEMVLNERKKQEKYIINQIKKIK